MTVIIPTIGQKHVVNISNRCEFINLFSLLSSGQIIKPDCLEQEKKALVTECCSSNYHPVPSYFHISLQFARFPCFTPTKNKIPITAIISSRVVSLQSLSLEYFTIALLNQ